MKPAPLRPGRTAAALLAAWLIALAPGCAPRETDVARATREGVLLMGLDADPGDLDPQLASGIAEFNVQLSLAEGLVSLDPKTLAPVPALAGSWEVSGDGLVLTLHLRPDAVWSDGTPLTAADCAASWRRLLSPSLAAGYASLLYPVVNAEAYHKGRLADFASVGIEAPDPRTLQLRLNRPAGPFIPSLALPPAFPVPVAVIARHGPVDRRGNPWARPGTHVGNGPFRLKEWRPGQFVSVERNPVHNGARNVRLNGVRFLTVENLEAEERMYRAGQLHVVSALPVSRIDAWRREQPGALREVPFLGTDFLRINTTRPGLDDPRVRHALSLALDRRALVGRALAGTKQAARGFVAPGIPGYTAGDGCPHDPEAARRLLAEAGHAGGRGLPPLTLLFNSSTQHRAVAEVVQELWRRELGIEVRLENQEKKVVDQTRATGAFDLLRSSWTADYPDPAAFLEIMTGGNSNNFTGWADPAFDAALAEAVAAADPAARNAALHRAEQRLLTASPILPLYHYTSFYLVHPSVHGWEGNPLDRRPTAHLWLQD